ncbi:hypothetical protein DPV74_40045 [Burkholderia sp. HAN2018]|nr:hypothetical protein [Burkholderia sp. HAN2018]
MPACQFAGQSFEPETRPQFVGYTTRGCLNKIPHGNDDGIDADIFACEQFVDKLIKPWGLDDIGKIGIARRKVLKACIGILIEPIFRISREMRVEAACREVLDQEACSGTAGARDEKVMFQFSVSYRK